MRPIRFLIPSLVAAGFGAHASTPLVASGVSDGSDGDAGRARLFDIFKQGHTITLADHRSHSSHSSHRSSSGGGGGHYSHMSHTSHRSSTGGYGDYGGSYSPPAYSPAPSPAPSSSHTNGILPLRSAQTGEATPPRTDRLPALSGRTERFKAIVKRVQIALLAQGYYEGSIDGVVGPGMRGAIRKFQSARTLPITGTITSEVLDALRVASQ